MMRGIRFLWLALALAAVAPLTARAQDDTVPAPQWRGRRMEPLAGLRLGFPQKLSAYVGLAWAAKRSEHGYTGWALTVEPGLGGGLAGIGPTASGGIGMTARVQGAVLRTWGEPWLVGPDRTYVGLDSRFTFGYVGIAVGGYVRVPEDGGDPGLLLTSGITFGL